ncbi:MAG: hypothetical protein ACTIA6_12440 [Pseudoclavibacter sp.]
MLEIRTYTLASEEALAQYADIHWARHISSLAQFGITTHHVWREVGTKDFRLIAVVEYEVGADPEAVTKAYMSSAEFRADMDGFPMDAIRGVSSVFVEPVSSDPVA